VEERRFSAASALELTVGPCCAPMIPSPALFAKCAKRMGGPGLGPDLVVTAVCELDQIKVAEDLKLLTNFRTHIHITRMQRL
jgi:hypothetical protein